MSEIIFILGSACFGYLIAEGMQPIQWLKNRYFNSIDHWYLYCPMCITFWIALAMYWFASVEFNLISCIFLSSISSIISDLIYKIINLDLWN